MEKTGPGKKGHPLTGAKLGGGREGRLFIHFLI